MPVFFERLQQSSRYYGRDIPEFLRTHPVSTSRISDTRSRANKYAYRQYPDSQGYLLAKAKLRVITAVNKKKVAKYFKAREHLGTKNQQAIARYGMGLIHLESQKFSKAEKIFQQLIKEYPEQPQYAYAVAKTAIEAQHYQKALQLFEHSFDRFPYNNAIKMDYIDALLKAKKPQKAKVILYSLSGKQKTQPLYFELIAKVYSDLKQSAESHRYLAEYYYATGNIQSAILQIQLAKKTEKTNFYQQAILNERLHFFLEEERERQLNQ
jgi:predicted Zn-dependent protease